MEAAARSGVAAVLPVPPALAGNARLAAAVVRGRADLGGPGRRGARAARRATASSRPASAACSAWVTADGLRFPTPVARDRAAGIARVSWTPEADAGPGRLPRGARRLADVGWRGLVTVGIAPDGELAEVAAGFSLDIAVLERAHGVDAVELALRSAAGGRSRPRRRGMPHGPPSSSSCGPPCRRATPGRVTGRLPGTGPVPAPGEDVERGRRERLRAR